ncbi:MAG TPA: hypothetical protein ENK46_06415 [Flavobacteriia bacterium]|nr:hypothetical protein [Flavobacteriia bacterium]
MKKIEFIFKVLLFLVIMQSCEQFNPVDPITPTCLWDENNQVSFTNLQLHHPSGLSNFHISQIPQDRIERSLVNILEVNGDAGSPSQAKITVNLKANGDACVGEKTVAFMQGAPEVSIATINVPFVSNAIFLGEVTVGIRGDTFRNTIGSGTFYHIVWTGSGNDPNGGVVGSIAGTKITYSNRDGSSKKKVISKDGCYIQNGQTVCM